MRTNGTRSDIATAVQRAAAFFTRSRDLDCADAQKLMSPFIDSMATADEVEQLQVHTAACDPCKRQLQSLISLRSLLARIEQPSPPEDLVLESRVRLSHERHSNYFEQLENRIATSLRQVAIPAIFGVSLTTLLFGLLFGSLVPNNTVLASDRITNDILVATYKPVRTTEPTMLHFAVSDKKYWEDALMIETHVGGDGRVIDYEIISGKQDPEVDKWVSQLLYFAQFTPATAFGRPVDSRIILSFVAVRS
jgi:hypothetical protein